MATDQNNMTGQNGATGDWGSGMVDNAAALARANAPDKKEV